MMTRVPSISAKHMMSMSLSSPSMSGAEHVNSPGSTSSSRVTNIAKLNSASRRSGAAMPESGGVGGGVLPAITVAGARVTAAASTDTVAVATVPITRRSYPPGWGRSRRLAPSGVTTVSGAAEAGQGHDITPTGRTSSYAKGERVTRSPLQRPLGLEPLKNSENCGEQHKTSKRRTTQNLVTPVPTACGYLEWYDSSACRSRVKVPATGRYSRSLLGSPTAPRQAPGNQVERTRFQRRDRAAFA